MANIRHCTLLLVLFALTSAFLSSTAIAADTKPLFTGNENHPADAIILFDGKDTSAMRSGDNGPIKWKVENGYMEVVPGTGDIFSKQNFTDCQLHVEFWLPLMADARGQGRSNSGVYLRNHDEVQVLDSYGLESKADDCGAIYGVAAPMVNACRPPEQWQTYDIIYHAPAFAADGKQTSRARFTVIQNGVLIHDNREVPADIVPSTPNDKKDDGPLKLQDHGNKVRYRNIWIRPL